MSADRTSPRTEHERLSELLGAYMDDELAADQVQLLKAHLLACKHCRQALALQRNMQARLQNEPIDRASGALRKRILAQIQNDTTQPAVKRRRPWRHRTVAWAGWVLAACLLLLIGLHLVSGRHTTAQPIPMVSAVLADYHEQLAGELPLSDTTSLTALENILPFPVTPIAALQNHLITAWPLRISGEPAAALAYRLDDHVIVQYVVSESVFFRQPQVREAVAAHGVYFVSAGRDSVVAWPGLDSGSLLVGPVSIDRLESLQPQEGKL